MPVLTRAHVYGYPVTGPCARHLRPANFSDAHGPVPRYAAGDPFPAAAQKPGISFTDHIWGYSAAGTGIVFRGSPACGTGFVFGAEPALAVFFIDNGFVVVTPTRTVVDLFAFFVDISLDHAAFPGDIARNISADEAYRHLPRGFRAVFSGSRQECGKENN